MAEITFPNLDLAAGVITYNSNDIQFSYLRVEPLIDQAIDILERALKTRAEYDTLAAKFFDVQLASLRDRLEVEIEREEISSGYTDLPSQETKANVSGQQQLIAELTQANSQTKALSNHLATQRSNLIYAAHAEAGAMRLPWKQSDFGDGTGTTGVPWPTPGPPVQFKGIMEVAQGAAEVQAGFAIDTEQFKASGQDHAEMAALNQATAQLGVPGAAASTSGLYAKLAWNQLDAQFRAKRQDALAQQQQMRADALGADNGAINFQVAMDWLVKRYQRDFGDAGARLAQVSIGLERLYGYVDPLYASRNRRLPAEDPGPRFDNWLIWVRDAASWLIRFSQTDQQVTVTVSIKSLIKDWPAFTDGKVVTLDLDKLPNVPPNFANVRMRGLSVFSLFSNASLEHAAHELLQLTIKPPSSSYCIHAGDPKTKVSLPQDQLRPCFAGRVLPRILPQQPDLLGADNLYNASPYGTWQVQMLSSKAAKKHLEDIEIDLFLKVQVIV